MLEFLAHRDKERATLAILEKCLEAKKMKENENPETLKCLRGFFFFFFFFFFYGKGWVEFGYIVFGLNGAQWVFS